MQQVRFHSAWTAKIEEELMNIFLTLGMKTRLKIRTESYTYSEVFSSCCNASAERKIAKQFY